jgi:predicted Rossmann fold nucleotide-binding protein DprA/Smf involved in DNA uptake
MQLTPQAQAVMLLTVSFGKLESQDAKPLSNGEWAKFAVWLRDHDLEPAVLLRDDLDSVLAHWVDRAVSIARIRSLLGRGAALGLALEKWQRAGLWVLTRSDQDYPERLKRRLRSESPPVLFGCGNKALLNTGGIAVVGSRDADEQDLLYTEKLGAETARQGHSLVSGGARGVDQIAMLAALENHGTAIGVLADSLLRSATAAIYRKYIMAGDLVLISPFNPDAGFNVGHAMSRNRYIYCLSDAAVVISSTRDKGGTWNGAIEDIRAGWVPLWVKPNNARMSGNGDLAQRGAQWLPEERFSLSILFEKIHSEPRLDFGGELPLRVRDDEPRTAPKTTIKTATGPTQTIPPSSQPTISPENNHSKPAAQSSAPPAVDFYSLFLARLQELTATAPMTAGDIAARLELENKQVGAWLKRAEGDGKISKLKKPVRYQTSPAGEKQPALFGDQ